MKKALIVIASFAVAAVVAAKIIRDRLKRRVEEGYGTDEGYGAAAA